MGAETRITVQVEVTRTEFRTIYAVTLDEAKAKAHSLPGVIDVIDAYYEDDRPEGCAAAHITR
jgi:hypothetical protein